MPATDLHDPEDRDATGVKVKYLYCPDCGHYSGGGICRVCERGFGDFTPPEPAAAGVAILCSREGGCEVVSLPLAFSASETREARRQLLL